MSRSPLSYPLNRGADLDGGGVADLQTDVMRFMAILCLCLVAIFALVQSVPVSAPTLPAPLPPADRPAVASLPRALAEEPPAAAPDPVREARSESPPAAAPPIPDAIAPPSPPSERPVPRTRPSLAAPAPVAPAAAAPEPDDGFTLRFESDSSLKALVAREEIGLYAIAGDSAMRLSIERGRLQFWTASLPSRFHEMDPATVPSDVARAFVRAGADESLRWGVTLPPDLSRQLDRYLRNETGGELIIAADGSMRRE